MSIRLRLALWYGLLFAGILLTVTAFSYAFHARGHYDDLDRALITTASHTADEVAISPSAPILIEGSGGFRVILRLYGPDGRLLGASAGAAGAAGTPAVDPRIVVAHPAGPAFDPVAGIAPPMAAPTPPPGSAFGIVATSAERWRVFVLPVQRERSIVEYVEAGVPLGDIDRSMQVFRLLLVGLSVLGLAVALTGSCLVAGTALRPIARMIASADRIARSRDLSTRINVPRAHDEIGRLARTFNGMLASIEEAYTAQQRFVSDASHELRAPLTAIQANLDLLRRHPEMSDADRREALAEAERESTRLTRLVADLLALARADAGLPLRFSIVDLDAIVLEVFSNARQLSRGQTLTLDQFEPVQVRGDEDRLKQLLLILLDNALKYTPPEGTVTIGLRHGGNAAEMVVHDTGVGISEDALPHVFERFYRADPGRGRDPGGTGLGLPIADWIAHQHGGRIDITSRLGAGTTVTVRLPSANTEYAAISAAAMHRAGL
ncbi:MAG TPA: HAMP domain-containing sensor histidine kinase [Ktedonobacterales bacterium]|nr:HAMP domain-containing sensor histidine kinase [Ktedonobacterales bacterium]